MRTKSSLINMAVNVFGQFFNLILAFAGRSMLVRYLSVDYLGVNGLLSNIFNVLSVTELGIGTAMLYGMYKPVADQDEQKITRLLNMYRRLYRLVAAGVAAAGIVLLPFLGYFIKGGTQIAHIRLYYVLYLLQTVSSYLLTYRASIIFAHQKQYISNFVTYIFTVVRYLLQIILLAATKNYSLYLLVQIICNVLSNWVIARQAGKMYPYIDKDKHSLPTKEEKRKLYKNIGAMSMHKIGAVCVYNTDSLLMSAFVGLRSVGIYSNYRLILSSVSLFFQQIFASFTASVGNLGASEKSGKIYEVYRILYMASFLCYGYGVAMMALLFRPFITLTFGKEYVFGPFVVCLILMDFYFGGMRQVIMCFRDTMGVFWYDRYKPVLEAAINLILSIILVQKYEIAGILMGTVLSFLFTSFWVEPYVFFKYAVKEGYRKKLKRFFGQYFLNFVIIAAVTAAVLLICSPVPETNFFWFIIKGIAGTICYFLLMTAASWKREDARKLMSAVCGRLSDLFKLNYGKAFGYKLLGLRFLCRLFPSKSSVRYSMEMKRRKAVKEWISAFCGSMEYGRESIKDEKGKGGQRPEEKRVWCFWWQKPEHAPELVKICFRSLKEQFPEREAVIITEENIRNYIKLPDFVYQKLGEGKISFAFFSDILRMSLLAEYGGIWCDATIYLMDSPEEEMRNYEFYTVKGRRDKTYVSENRWSGFFIKAPKGCPLCAACRDLLYAYCRSQEELIDYFLIDYLIDFLYENDEAIRSLIDSVPVNNPGCHELQGLLNMPFSESAVRQTAEESCIFKLNYRGEFQKETVHHENTVYGWLAERTADK